METLFIVARYVLGIYFIFSGAMHVMKLSGMVGYAKMKGLPFPTLGVLLSGALMLLAGLDIIFQRYLEYSLLALAAFLVLAALIFHNFWADSDPNQKMMNMTHFLKNIALASALMMILGAL